jgi:hypothetical protein
MIPFHRKRACATCHNIFEKYPPAGAKSNSPVWLIWRNDAHAHSASLAKPFRRIGRLLGENHVSDRRRLAEAPT